MGKQPCVVISWRKQMEHVLEIVVSGELQLFPRLWDIF